ncbi:MAG: hypothetical protein SFY56_11630, partial [Bacteroidota bacterium]|nr:hypothetical protein [Bacteroidota bacterium]
MKLLLKNSLLPININCFFTLKHKTLLCLMFFYCLTVKTQIANYVNNGGFEIPRTSNQQQPVFWSAIDSTKFLGLMYSYTISPYLVPLSSLTYQWPKSGNAWFGTTFFYKPNTPQTLRGYPRNTLKATLQAGKTYCVKFYVNITTQSTYGIDAIGAYFGDNSTDTITHCMTPISYLNPQIQNTSGIITDTLNWVPITGTFVANGNEKYMILGNFKSDAATNSVMINPTNLPLIFTDVLFDDVSCIPIDLPAYAGADIWAIPGNTVYLGRSQDVGIDEACTWYNLTNTTTPVANAAGFSLTVSAITATYMVKQDICGVIKYDTVVVHASALGNVEWQMLNDKLKLYPNPANELLN